VSGVDKNRRRLLAALTLLIVAGVTNAHTPYRQWVVYRRKHLLIGTTRADPDGYRLGKALAGALATELPESQARVARARDTRRLANLMATGQLQTALFNIEEVLAMAAGSSPYEDIGPLDLRVLLILDRYLLMAVPTLPDHHAWLVTSALEVAGYGTSQLIGADGISFHPGSRAYLDGRRMPDPPIEPVD